MFGKGNVYAELQRHFNREEEARNQAVIEIARRLKLPLLATNGVCHATRGAARSGRCFHLHPQSCATGNCRPFARHQFRTVSEIAARQCSSSLPICRKQFTTRSSFRRVWNLRLKDLGYEFPKYPVPAGETMTSFLRQRTDEGARWRYTGRNGKPTYERARQADRT